MFYVLRATHATLISDHITFNQEAAYVHLKFTFLMFWLHDIILKTDFNWISHRFSD